MQFLILKTVYDSWLYLNPNAILALNEEYNGTTLTLVSEVRDSLGRKSKTFTVVDELEAMMRLIQAASS
ncbi:hypothetical protein [Entomospira culicis]|uniref:Uncharacterized protein n=1 Tax=Entomospira culicis TaxID=2719989 RepID=A0A968KW16_9SPIO|nr:hypothetical protein [Entomospira culicis]NIZ19352.1 hypothetical protein [Entomospira culicis]NIZ69743.1 hypothetical protein [Entomospira culicis]WDI36854.1 hypothetical protein PVA46_05885 [Entomospira culicis]WDI38483.1 hypothetical protein PVA47_05895 [Entomospira culicis]